MNFTQYKGDFGSSLQGHFDQAMTYQEVASVIGEATNNENIDNKVNWEWVLKFDDGVIATIYNYKDNYRGKDAKRVWHIGGEDRVVVERVNELFKV